MTSTRPISRRPQRQRIRDRSSRQRGSKGRLNGGRRHSAPQRSYRRRTSASPLRIRQTDPRAEASAALREQLAGRTAGIASADEAATWAHRILGAKNSLTAADARQVEDAFQARLATFDTAADIERRAVIAKLIIRAPSRLRHWSGGQPEPAAETSTARRHRQEPVGPSRAAPLSRPGPRQVRGQTAVPDLRPQALRCPSSAVRAASARSGAKSATSSPCRCAGATTARSIAAGDEAAWWKKAGIDPTVPPARFGWRRIRCRTSDETAPISDSLASQRTNRRTKRDRPAASAPKLQNEANYRGWHCNDFLQADRGQPAQCAQKHRADHRRRQAALPLQCGPPRPHGRDGDRRAGGCRRLPGLRSGHYCRL